MWSTNNANDSQNKEKKTLSNFGFKCPKQMAAGQSQNEFLNFYVKTKTEIPKFFG